jgi:hypothetical protein
MHRRKAQVNWWTTFGRTASSGYLLELGGWRPWGGLTPQLGRRDSAVAYPAQPLPPLFLFTSSNVRTRVRAVR